MSRHDPFLLGRGMMRLAAPGGTRGLSILIYHRVLPAPDPLFPDEVDRQRFDQHLSWLKSACQVLPLDEAVERLRSGSLPPRAACISFDDGYADNEAVALPILQQHGLTATFFVATGFLDGGRMWNDTVIELVRRAPGERLATGALGWGDYPLTTIDERRQAIAALIGKLKYVPMDERLAQVQRLVDGVGIALPDDLMMRSSQVRALRAAGMGIGGHTVRHPILARLPAARARDEIAEGKAALEALLGERISVFAYPNGKPGQDYTAEHVQMVRALGFSGAVSTSWGASRSPDLYQLPRCTPWDRSRMRFVARLARNLMTEATTA